jgi:hypothetical protein
MFQSIAIMAIDNVETLMGSMERFIKNQFRSHVFLRGKETGIIWRKTRDTRQIIVSFPLSFLSFDTKEEREEREETQGKIIENAHTFSYFSVSLFIIGTYQPSPSHFLVKDSIGHRYLFLIRCPENPLRKWEREVLTSAQL